MKPRRVAIGALTAALLLAAAPALGVTADDVEQARQARNEVAARLDAVTERYDAAIDRAAELEDEVRRLTRLVAEGQAEVASGEARAKAIVREIYMSAGTIGLANVLDTGSVEDAAVKLTYLERVGDADIAELRRYEATAANLSAQLERLDAALSAQRDTVAEIERLAASILVELRAADAAYSEVLARRAAEEAARQEAERRAAEEAARREAEARAAAAATTTTVATTTTEAGGAASTTTTQPATTTTTQPATTTTTTTTPPPDTGGPAMVCPVDGATTFVDSFGDPRSGGRRHQGIDMIAARGTPLVAIEAGTVQRMRSGGLGGITVWLLGDSGDEYYYAHLDAWADGLAEGDRLEVGDLLGTVGNTGNAAYTLPHLHFEIHPDGGAAINPYPVMVELCR